MIVVDASAVLELLLNTRTGVRVSERLTMSGETLHAPHLLDVEVAQVVRRYMRNGDLGQERGLEALADFMALPIERYPHAEMLGRMLQLRNSLTAYDAAYVVLAEALEASLVTCDVRLSRSHGHTATVELIR